MQVFDVVPFFDEIDLLEIRLETLNPYVDYFVISEFSTSFAGHDKKFHFEENKALFQKFGKKIMNFSNHQRKIFEPFANDNYQKNAIKDLIKPYLSKNDVIIFGDVDEIPNPALLPELFFENA